MSARASGYALARTVLMTAALAVLVTTAAHAQSTFTVDATSDGADANTSDGVCDDGAGACTLRAAIEQANATGGLDSIHFDIPGAGAHTIQPSTLPEVTDPVILDGYTQPGASANTNGPDHGSNAVILIELDASLTNGTGLEISAGGSTVRGLAVHSAGDWGIRLFSNGHNTVEGNFLGLNATGDAVPGFSYHLVLIQSSRNIVGGMTPAARNVIEPGVTGVRMEAGGDSTIVQGNLFGLDATGAQSLNTSGTGVTAVDVEGTLIGGTSAAARNVMAGLFKGISVQGSSVNTVIQGNYIGTDVTGMSAILISSDGIHLLSPSSLTTVGGPGAGEGNLISGTSDPGIRIHATSNTVQGNVFGLDAAGTGALPFDYEGVYLASGAHDNLIGGTAPGEGNVVTNAGTQGISVAGDATVTRNTLSGNSVYDNPIGIDLGYDGVTLNDPDDSDAGPNGLLNFPDLALAHAGSTAAAVQGSYTGAAGSALTLEFFASDACSATGYGEGERFLGTGSVTTDGTGHGTFMTMLTGLPSPGDAVTATATDADGSTSEFSECLIAAGYTVAVAPDTVRISAGQSASFTVTVAATGPGFGQPVSLACAGALPIGALCSFSPPEVTPGKTSATSTMTVGVEPASGTPLAPAGPMGGVDPMAGLLLLGGFMTLLAARSAAQRRVPRAVAVGLALAGVAAFSVGCKGDPSGPSTDGPVASAFTVVGTSGPIAEADGVVVVVE